MKQNLSIEVTNISRHGMWILTHGRKLFLSYEDLPWFQGKPIKAVTNVVEQSPGHFYWPDIDVDLSLNIIKSPEKFPLKAQ